MTIYFPPVAGRKAPGNPQTTPANWQAELRRREQEAARRDRAAFLRYKGS